MYRGASPRASVNLTIIWYEVLTFSVLNHSPLPCLICYDTCSVSFSCVSLRGVLGAMLNLNLVPRLRNASRTFLVNHCIGRRLACFYHHCHVSLGVRSVLQGVVPEKIRWGRPRSCRQVVLDEDPGSDRCTEPHNWCNRLPSHASGDLSGNWHVD